jgi:transmembrane sensor
MTDSAHDASDRAVLWLIRKGEPDWSDEQEQEFETWLGESMLHRAAYLRQREGWRAADRLASLGAANFAPIASSSPRADRGVVIWAIAACFALIAAGAIGFKLVTLGPAAPRQTFTTEVGVHDAIPLNDGSRIELNTASAIQTAISKDRREVWLDRGEAYFEVAHKDGLPFVVHAGARDVIVLGTRFSVRRDGGKVTVAVAEGKVKVDNPDDPDAVSSTIITAGDVAIALGPSTLVADWGEDQVKRSLAWRGGMLSFSDARLADVAGEFNRYNIRQIRISNGRTADIKIDGAFQASNVEAFVRLLRDAYGLEIKETAKGIEISEP